MKNPLPIRIAAWVLFFLAGWLVLSCCDLVSRGFVVIFPDPDDSRILYVNQHRWFSRNETIKLEPRRDDYGQWLWMYQTTNGSWSTYFRRE